MEMVTLKELARQKGVTYESVRRLVKKYERDLQGHILMREDGARLLDPEAVAFLTERRRINNIVVAKAEEAGEEAAAANEKIEELREKLLAAQKEIMTLQQARLSDQARIIALQDEVKLGIEAKAEYDAAQAARTAAEARAEELQRQRDADRQQLDQAKAELESFVPSLFGFYRKKKP